MTFGQYCFNNSEFEPEKLLKSFKITIKENKANDVECTTTENSLQTGKMTITWNKSSNFGIQYDPHSVTQRYPQTTIFISKTNGKYTLQHPHYRVDKMSILALNYTYLDKNILEMLFSSNTV